MTINTTVLTTPSARRSDALRLWFDLITHCASDDDSSLPARVAQTRARERLDTETLETFVKIAYRVTGIPALSGLICTDYITAKANEIAEANRVWQHLEATLDQTNAELAEKVAESADKALITHFIEPIASAIGEAWMGGRTFAHIKEQIEYAIHDVDSPLAA